MVIEGYFAGTVPKQNTDRDVEQLRDHYRRAYPSIKLNFEELTPRNAEIVNYSQALALLEVASTDNLSLKQS